MEEITLIELFAGIGAQYTALKNVCARHNVKCKCIGISEIMPIALEAYERVHGECNNFGDITKIETLPYCDVMTYSFPCQSLSQLNVNSKVKGMAKDSKTKSSLLWEVVRILKNMEKKPKYLLMENVDQITNKLNIKNFNQWINFLSSLGYVSTYFELNADVFLPQNRNRAFMVSSLEEPFTYVKPKQRDYDISNYLEREREREIGKIQSVLIHRNFKDGKIRQRDSYIYPTVPGGYEVYFPKFNDKTRYIPNKIHTLTTKDCFVWDGKHITYISPHERWLLMGNSEETWEKVKYMSKNKIQILTGNSIVVPCLEHIFECMFFNKVEQKSIMDY